MVGNDMANLAQIFLCLSVVFLGISVVATVFYVRYTFRVLTEMVGATIQVSIKDHPEVVNEVDNERERVREQN